MLGLLSSSILEYNAEEIRHQSLKSMRHKIILFGGRRKGAQARWLALILLAIFFLTPLFAFGLLNHRIPPGAYRARSFIVVMIRAALWRGGITTG